MHQLVCKHWPTICRAVVKYKKVTQTKNGELIGSNLQHLLANQSMEYTVHFLLPGGLEEAGRRPNLLSNVTVKRFLIQSKLYKRKQLKMAEIVY